jgi:hypothetical protein
MVSRCCKKEVFSLVDYYTCSRCHFPCDIVHEKPYKEMLHEFRHENETENAFN